MILDPTFRPGEYRVHEPAVVASEDRDPVPRLEPPLLPGVRQTVRALVQLGEGELAAVVDQADPVPGADRRRGHGAADHPVAVEREHDPRHAMRELRSNQPAAHAERDEVRLIPEPLRQAGGATEDRLRIEVHVGQNLPDHVREKRLR